LIMTDWSVIILGMAKAAKQPAKSTAAAPARPAASATARGGASHRPGAIASSRHDARIAKAAARRDAILTAALDEFSAKGFAAARLDDVAKRAGVAKGTIYLYFADKESLFQELIRAKIVPVVGSIEAALATGLPLRAVIDQAIEIFIRDVFSTHRKQVIRLILSEGPRFPALAEFYYREVLSRILQAVRGRLRQAYERGELPNDALVRFPMLLGAPGIIAIIWSGLFERFEPLDVRGLMRAHFQNLLDPGRAA
jgi:AcrR family transcriptional regulator